MLVICVETSSLMGSIALFHNQTLLGSTEWSRSGSHSERLNQSLVSLLNKNNLKLQDISRLAVGLGPGSFTGIRVGINFVRALSYSLGIPVYPICSLELLASQAFSETAIFIFAAQYGFRNLIYCQSFQKVGTAWGPKSPPLAMTPNQIISSITDPHLFIGTGYDLILKEIPQLKSSLLTRRLDFSDNPHAKFFLNTPALDESPANLFDWINVKPLYVRASEAEEKLKARALSPL